MVEKISTYRQLDVWKKGMELVKDFYSITKEFPKEEKYGLVSQMRRASVSLPTNVAEGFKRRHNKEFRQFLYISMGSCAELETLIMIARQLEYVN